MDDDLQTFMLSLRRWDDLPDDGPAQDLMRDAADAIDRLTSKLGSCEESLGAARQELESMADWKGRAVDERQRRVAAESRLDRAAKAWEKYQDGVSGISISEAMRELDAALAPAGESPACGASCSPQIPRMGMYGICQLPAGHEGEHDASVVETKRALKRCPSCGEEHFNALEFCPECGCANMGRAVERRVTLIDEQTDMYRCVCGETFSAGHKMAVLWICPHCNQRVDLPLSE